MGMFDEFEMVPPIVCSCGQVLTHRWQSKDGPCNLIKFKQGEPIRADVWTDGEGDSLPDSFELYTFCEEWVDDPERPASKGYRFNKKKIGCGQFIEKRGVIENGVWTRVEDGPPEYMTPEEQAAAQFELTDEVKAQIAKQVQEITGPAFMQRAFHDALFPQLLAKAGPKSSSSKDAIGRDLAVVLKRFENRLFTARVRAEVEQVLNLRLHELGLDRVWGVRPKLDSYGVLRLGLYLLDGEDDEARRDGSMDRPDQDRGGGDPGTT